MIIKNNIIELIIHINNDIIKIHIYDRIDISVNTNSHQVFLNLQII